MPLRCEFLRREKGETMPTLTIEDIRNNPWNVITNPLPEFPSEILLEVAYRAAEYCFRSEYELMEAARHRRYIPSWFNTDEILPDAHEDSEDRYLRSLDKYDEIRARFETEFIDVTEDNDVEEVRISMMRRVLRRVQGWLSRSE
jgi:hypothetical protein